MPAAQLPGTDSNVSLDSDVDGVTDSNGHEVLTGTRVTKTGAAGDPYAKGRIR